MTATDTPTLYKITAPDGTCYNGGDGQWDLPTATEPGAWWRVDGPIEACRNGLHVTDAEHVRHWIGSEPFIIHRVEIDGPIVNAGEKYVVAAARLLPRKRPLRKAADMAAAMRKRDRAITRAERAYLHALDAAPAVGAYLARLRDVTLPEGHPMRATQVIHAAAERERARAIETARATYDAATLPALRLEDV